MPRTVKPSREYHETLRRAGIKNPGETLWQLPIQLVNVVDDLSYVKPPMVTPFAGGGIEKLAVGGQSGITVEIEIRSAGGAWIVATGTVSTPATELYTSTASLITIGSATFTPAFLSPPDGSVPVQSVFRHGYAGTIATQGIGLGVFIGVFSPGSFWVPRGTFVGLKGHTLNALAYGFILIREIPVGAPGEA
jgi:hypothetical protein